MRALSFFLAMSFVLSPTLSRSQSISSQGQPTPTNWWWCDASRAYYPAVGTCATPWRAVDAQGQPIERSSVPPAAPAAAGGYTPPPSPTPSTRWWCESSLSYYPIVTTCATPWLTPEQRMERRLGGYPRSVVPPDTPPPSVASSPAPTNSGQTPAPTLSPSAQSSLHTSLSGGDLQKIVGTYQENEMRFKRDFFGRQFSDVLPFRSAKESILFEGKYLIGFGTGRFLSDVDCEVTSPADVARIANWNKGDEIHIEGIVKDVTMGSVELDQCSLTRQSD